MSRSVPWQLTASAAVSWNQDQALNSTIYILRELGPTSFLLKEDGENSKKFRVSLGDPHVCTCVKFKKERQLCKHICWLLLKKFKLDRWHDLSFQLGLVEREIGEVLRGLKMIKKNKSIEHMKNESESNIDSNGKTLIKQRPLSEEDVCPICQEQLLAKHQPVTYCRYGCGNSVHIKCMKVFADHQRQSTGDTTVHCPFCREEFGTQIRLAQEFRNTLYDKPTQRFTHERLETHFGVNCLGCNMSPIKGKCYQCNTCVGFHLCNTCYHGHQHLHHSFVFRQKKSQRWRPAPSRENTGHRETLLGPIANELQNREITENDYDILLELDRNQPGPDIPVDLDGLPEHLINKLPMIKIKEGGRQLLPGRQCRICLRAYNKGEFVRRLPVCGHTFHRECIDKWLTDDHRCCPIDRQPVYQPHIERNNVSSTGQSSTTVQPTGDNADLVIPGIGLIHTPSLEQAMNRTRLVAGKGRAIKSSPIKRNTVKHEENIPNHFTIGELLVQADAIGLPRSKSSHSLTNLPKTQPVHFLVRQEPKPRKAVSILQTDQILGSGARPSSKTHESKQKASENNSSRNKLNRKPKWKSNNQKVDISDQTDDLSLTGTPFKSQSNHEPQNEAQFNNFPIPDSIISYVNKAQHEYDADEFFYAPTTSPSNYRPSSPVPCNYSSPFDDGHIIVNVEKVTAPADIYKPNLLSVQTNAGDATFLDKKSAVTNLRRPKFGNPKRTVNKLPNEDEWELNTNGDVERSKPGFTNGLLGIKLSK